MGAAVVLDANGGAVPCAARLGGGGSFAALDDQMGGDLDVAGRNELALGAGGDLVAHGGESGQVFGVVDGPAVGLSAGACFVDPFGRLAHAELDVVFDRAGVGEFALKVAAGSPAVLHLGFDAGASFGGGAGGALGRRQGLFGLCELALKPRPWGLGRDRFESIAF